jgi:hypothetical protein
MVRARYASVILLLWCALQAWSLLAFENIVHHRRLVGWGVIAIFLAIAGGLWFAKRWARIALLLIGGALLIAYVAIAYFDGAGCSNHSHWFRCYSMVYSQPLLVVVALAILVRPLAPKSQFERSRGAPSVNQGEGR